MPAALPAASPSLDQQVRHFVAVYKAELVRAGEAMMRGDASVLEALVTRVSESKVVRHITNLVAASREAYQRFVTWVDAQVPEGARSAILGGIATVVGGAMAGFSLGVAAGLSAVLGVTVTPALVCVVGALLCVLGLATLKSAYWSKASSWLGGVG